MNHNMKRTAKGFTLIELIIVIAIIGILLGILMPSMMNYYRRSRIQAANADAKMVYNAAQTAAQRFIAQDRMAATPTGFAGSVNVVYTPVGPVFSSGGVGGAIADPDAVDELVTTVNRTVSGADEICWAVRVDNYLVKASVAAENMSTTNYGTYSRRESASVDRAPSIATLQSVRDYPHSFSSGSNTTDTAGIVALLEEIRKNYDGE